DIAYPLLKQYHMKATNNVITGTVGNEANLSLDEMKEMKENGISLQGHTVTHPALGNTDPTVQNSELADSKTYLDSNLGQDT
ncbi:polysaccharide deacetylase family protein, partial [Streptococcus pyogenes]